ncbi:FYN-binding protein 1 [Engraulis encrasicolus]|uniref:FYN-binding protein 1 n=1 Tax=Engraulis encrasicolus TaxID=184585 RepID=UPI002FD59881
MNAYTKALLNNSPNPSTPNPPWADNKRPVNRNVSSGVLNMGTRFETFSDAGGCGENSGGTKTQLPKPVVSKLSSNFMQPSQSTFNNTPGISKDKDRPTFPSPSQLKPVGAPKPPLNPGKLSSLNPTSSTAAIVGTGGGAADRPMVPAGPTAPLSGWKPKPSVQMRTIPVQECAQENNAQKEVAQRTLSTGKITSPFLCQRQQATPSVDKDADCGAEDVVKPPPLSKLPSSNLGPKLANIQVGFKQKPDTTGGFIPKDQTTEGAMPKIKPLPNVFALGKCPRKPQRPPHVDLSQFTSSSSNTDDLLPPPPSDVYVVPCESELNIAIEEQSYDDVGPMQSPQTHPGGIFQHSEETGVDEELYEDLEERWADNDQTETKKPPRDDQRKCDKEEKKRLEQEKKEQKLREKKEREARKKFKLSGAVQVLQEAKARVDCKGGRNELQLTQGETIQIIRMTDNPEGLWLARNSEGLYGYVKTASLTIDHNALKANCGQLMQDAAGDVYDDVGATDGTSMMNSFPPPPPDFIGIDDEVYDDVSSQPFPPPPPPLSGLPGGRAEEVDGKKKKKFEKDEKEFRKKFKYDGDITVLHKVVVDPALSCKKWGGKDLVLKPGESIDVIVKAQDGKLIGRNKDGKFGYVSVEHIQTDADIYDDVGEDCIYDN